MSRFDRLNSWWPRGLQEGENQPGACSFIWTETYCIMENICLPLLYKLAKTSTWHQVTGEAASAWCSVVLQYNRSKTLSTLYKRIYMFPIAGVNHSPTTQLTPTSWSSCFFLTQWVEENEERRSGLSEASHYYGNTAHKAQLCADSGCHGYSTRTIRRTELSLLPVKVGC